MIRRKRSVSSDVDEGDRTFGRLGGGRGEREEGRREDIKVAKKLRKTRHDHQG